MSNYYSKNYVTAIPMTYEEFAVKIWGRFHEGNTLFPQHADGYLVIPLEDTTTQHWYPTEQFEELFFKEEEKE